MAEEKFQKEEKLKSDMSVLEEKSENGDKDDTHKDNEREEGKTEKDLAGEETNGGSDEQEQKEGDRLAAVQDEIEELKEDKAAIMNRLQRLQADFSNYRKRVNKERETIGIKTKAELVLELLPVIDNFERALASHEKNGDFYKGVELIYRQLKQFLEKEGVEVIEAAGKPFDHNLHEAVLQVDDEEQESGIVIEEIQKGYKLDEKVIRPSMVKVAK